MLSMLTGASTLVVVAAGSGPEKSGVAEVQAIDQALVELPTLVASYHWPGCKHPFGDVGSIASGEDPRAIWPLEQSRHHPGRSAGASPHRSGAPAIFFAQRAPGAAPG
jgi:hypothetical protein